MNTFTINGVTYNAVPIGFNFLCDLEDAGISIEEADRKPMKLMRAYFSVCAKISVEEAGNQLGKHMADGGNIDSLAEAFQNELEKSDFFRNAKTDEGEKTPKTPKKTTK